jgi:hypothetical protein
VRHLSRQASSISCSTGLRGPVGFDSVPAGPFVAWAAPIYGWRIILMSFPRRHPKRTASACPELGPFLMCDL